MLALAVMFASGCSGAIQKNFRVDAVPPDADIRIVSGVDLKEQTFHSPAIVSVSVPKDPDLSAKAHVEVSRESYAPRTILLRDIRDKETIVVKLERIVLSTERYHLKFRQVGPVAADELRFQDKVVAIQFTVTDNAIQMKFDNRSEQTIKILWDQAEYTDVRDRRSRIIHPGIRFQDRNSALPPQTVLAGESIQEALMPVGLVVYSQQKKAYENQPLFMLDNDTAQGLKGKSFYVFIPIEIDRQIIPYNFKIQITDVVKDHVAPK